MNKIRFAKHIRAYTKHFLDHNPSHPDANNIRQYTDFNHVCILYDQYKHIIDDVKQSGAVSIIDIGSGIGVAKCVDPTITTANVDSDYFSEVEEVVNVVRDITLSDCTVTKKWVNTTRKFDCAILYRFMPWANETIDDNVRIKIFTEMSRILKPDGVLVYTPINPKQFLDRGWSRIHHEFYTFKLSQSDLQNELNKTTDEVL